MWFPAEIVLKSYLPLELEEGMLFINRISVGIMEPYVELWELEEVPNDIDSFMAINGAPVELLIVDDNESVLATHDQIGWWDDGPDTDELRDTSLDDINLVLREWEGCLSVYVDDDDYEEDNLVPVLIEGKVTLCLDQEENDDLEEEF